MRMLRSRAVWLWLVSPAVAWAEDVPKTQHEDEVRRARSNAWRSLLRLGMGQTGARYLGLGAAEVRWRFLGGNLYALGTGGTLLFPTPEGTLRPGAFASVGLGVDNAR